MPPGGPEPPSAAAAVRFAFLAAWRCLDDDDATPRLGAESAAFASACAFLTVALFA